MTSLEIGGKISAAVEPTKLCSKKLMYFSGRRISTVSVGKVRDKSTRVMVFHTIPIWLLCARTTAILGDETSASQTIQSGNEMCHAVSLLG